ncbi:ABC transporter substrate-binding protein [Muricoccus radiodurans]|uniref:ABC transporter substrate-binding protein n=1 Tax=Muricoccus radiodurans TaxID=2231721 RepID=UPI003CF5F926
MRRRTLLAAGSAALLPAPSIAQSPNARVLRLVPQANLTALDPMWTTASVTQGHGYHVFDTLYGVDEQLRPRPQMAEGHTVEDDGRTWLIRLRPGLKFHDGEPVRAQDCVASLMRWSRRDSFGQVLARAVDAWESADDRTLRIRLKRPFAPLLDAIAKPSSSAFIYPERLARTDPNTQVSEMIGSGPFRFVRDEFVSGSRVVYARFADYIPRDEPADYTSGGKRAYFDRVQWTVMPDAATAAAALQNNEVDWWEMVLPDLVPSLSRQRDMTVRAGDRFGYFALMRFNHLNKPFDNPALRRAVLSAVSQTDYLPAINGSDPRGWRTCAAMFPCGIPFVQEAGAGVMNRTSIEQSRAAVRAAGYAGEKVVIINPGDFPSIGPLGEITADLLKRIGMNVDLQTMDWGTVVQRRTSKAPADQGGWSIFHTWSTSVTMVNPPLNFYMRGQGQSGWFGWYENAEIERLTDAWAGATTDAEQQAIFDAIQKEAFEGVPMVPLGQFFPMTAYRNTLRDIIPSTNCYPWNVRRA